MGIEKDIRQQAFPSTHQKAMVNIMYSYGWVMERIKALLAREDITHQQYNILRILRGAHPEPLSTLQIRDRMIDRMSDTSRIVDRLILKALVQKEPSARDKRLVDVTITAKGLELLQKLDAISGEMDEIMKSLTETEAEMLSNLLDKLRSAE